MAKKSLTPERVHDLLGALTRQVENEVNGATGVKDPCALRVEFSADKWTIKPWHIVILYKNEGRDVMGEWAVIDMASGYVQALLGNGDINNSSTTYSIRTDAGYNKFLNALYAKGLRNIWE
jgi:hypothetical protein